MSTQSSFEGSADDGLGLIASLNTDRPPGDVFFLFLFTLEPPVLFVGVPDMLRDSVSTLVWLVGKKEIVEKKKTKRKQPTPSPLPRSTRSIAMIGFSWLWSNTQRAKRSNWFGVFDPSCRRKTWAILQGSSTGTGIQNTRQRTELLEGVNVYYFQ